jgi:hypothetical protein
MEADRGANAIMRSEKRNEIQANKLSKNRNRKWEENRREEKKQKIRRR